MPPVTFFTSVKPHSDTRYCARGRGEMKARSELKHEALCQNGGGRRRLEEGSVCTHTRNELLYRGVGHRYPAAPIPQVQGSDISLGVWQAEGRRVSGLPAGSVASRGQAGQWTACLKRACLLETCMRRAVTTLDQRVSSGSKEGGTGRYGCTAKLRRQGRTNTACIMV